MPPVLAMVLTRRCGRRQKFWHRPKTARGKSPRITTTRSGPHQTLQGKGCRKTRMGCKRCVTTSSNRKSSTEIRQWVYRGSAAKCDCIWTSLPPLRISKLAGMGQQDERDDDELLSYDSPWKHRSTRTGEDGNTSEAEALLEFYRQRFEQFQSERRVMLEHVANVEVSKEEFHHTKWELKTRKQEIADLEASLKSANATIFQLREEKLALEAAIEALRIQELDDRRKIQHLLALTQPVTEEVTFFRDCRPGAVASYPPASGATTYPYPSTMHIASEDMDRTPQSKKKPAAVGAKTKTRATTNQVLRTIYMPNDQAEALTRAISNLQDQLAKQQRLYEERIQHMLDEFADEKAKLHQEVKIQEQSREVLEKQLTKTQKILQKTTKDYLVLRHQSQESERMAKEELLLLSERCDGLVQEKAEATKEAIAEAESTKEKAQEETAQYTQQLRDQALSRERDLHILREQYAALQEACTKRIQDLQTRLAKLRTRYRNLEQRRAMEMEGFTCDIAAIKRNMQRLETALYGRRVFIQQQQRQHGESKLRHRNTVLDSTDLNDEIAALQERIADLAADVDAS